MKRLIDRYIGQYLIINFSLLEMTEQKFKGQTSTRHSFLCDELNKHSVHLCTWTCWMLFFVCVSVLSLSLSLTLICFHIAQLMRSPSQWLVPEHLTFRSKVIPPGTQMLRSGMHIYISVLGCLYCSNLCTHSHF